MINYGEILIANGVTMFMMWFLIDFRRKSRENIHTEDRIFDGMVLINLLGAFSETVSFLIDGREFAFGRAINYITNSLCFAGTVSIGMLWCLYVDFRIYRNYKRTTRHAEIVMLPWSLEIAAIVCNLFGTRVLFHVSEDNVYQRCNGSIIGYVTLMIYFSYSVYLVYHSKEQGINLSFFQLPYFVGPCLVGVLIQLFKYGITTSWISVAVALVFVQMQVCAENLYVDELSGLYNRRYLNAVLGEQEKKERRAMHGIMMDVNDFKMINDRFGHNVGDQAICTMGNILFKSIPDSGIAVRYAGDEFVVLLTEVDAKAVIATMDEIQNNIRQFNESEVEVYKLSVSMGYTEFRPQDDAEKFFTRMDKKMYEEKRRYHQKM